MDEVVGMISQVGFPMAVATYTLVILNKTIQENTKVMQKIANKLGVGDNE